jgi:ParB family chromosome partitioning protein
VQEGIRLGQISEAHAKLIKGLKSKERQVALYKQIVAMGLSVKATETLLREQKEHASDNGKGSAKDASRGSAGGDGKTAHIKSVEAELRQKLATDKGQFVIHFESNDDFMRILDVLQKG